MKKALKQAQIAYDEGEIPIGCVIVCDDKIIAEAHNAKQQQNNSLHHAEMIALDKAMAHLDTKYLYNCTLYVTIEPCAMCAGAMINCRLGKLVFGAKEPKTGCVGSVCNLLDANNFNHRVEVTSGVLEQECAELMKKFFISRRNKC